MQHSVDHTIELILQSGLFDRQFYAGQLSAAAAKLPLDALIDHYVSAGAAQGLNPNALFQTAYYLGMNPDVAAAGMNPLQHFISHGAHEGRYPNPFFDPRVYFATWPDLESKQTNPLAHYLRTNLLDKRATHENFDPQFYCASYPEVAVAGEDPLAHYLRIGELQNRQAFVRFDPDFYLSTYKDVAEAGLDPLTHYKLYGRAEGRLPRAHNGIESDKFRLQKLLKELDATKFKNLSNDINAEWTGAKVCWGGIVLEERQRELLCQCANQLPGINFVIHQALLANNQDLPDNVSVVQTEDHLMDRGCSLLIVPYEYSKISEVILSAVERELLIVCTEESEFAVLFEPSESNLIPGNLSVSKICHAIIYAYANIQSSTRKAQAAKHKLAQLTR